MPFLFHGGEVLLTELKSAFRCSPQRNNFEKSLISRRSSQAIIMQGRYTQCALKAGKTCTGYHCFCSFVDTLIG